MNWYNFKTKRLAFSTSQAKMVRDQYGTWKRIFWNFYWNQKPCYEPGAIITIIGE